MRCLAPIRALARDRRGAAALLLAFGLVFSLGCAAFAVDSASLYLASRRLQGAADAAALAAAGNPAAARPRAMQAIVDSGVPTPVELQVLTGEYRADPSIAAAARFAPGGTVNAAHVLLSTRAPLFFGLVLLGRHDAPISRAATATRTNLAAFSIGSRLASLDGGVANALAGALTGSRVSLSVMDYQALLDADVDLFGFVDALRTTAHLRTGSFDDTLDTAVRPADALGALGDALASEGGTTAAAAARKLAAAAATSSTIDMSRLIDLGRYGAQDRAGGTRISVQAWDLARTMLETASAGRQVKLDLSGGVAGLGQVSAWLSIGDRAADSPWLAVTDAGLPIVRTAQTRLYLDTTVGTVGLGLAGTAAVRMPLYVELAAAQARLNALSCDLRQGTERVTLDVQPSVGHAALADVSPDALPDQRTPATETPARLVTLPLVTVDGTARIDLSDGAWTSVSFDQDDIAAHRIKTVSSAGFVAAIAASLARQAQLNTHVLGVGVSAQAATSATAGALATGAPALDQLVASLLGLLGVHLGQADARIAGVRCGQTVLVG